MNVTAHLLNEILDTLSLQVAVLNAESHIVYVNQAWRTFGLFYGLDMETDWRGVAYLDICQANQDSNLPQLVHGVRSVLNGVITQFSFDYLCHTPTREPTWLTLNLQPFNNGQTEEKLFLLTLTNITHHKQAEHRISEITMTDPLTGIANRRRLDLFLRDEWSRAIRHQSSLSVMMVDADHFKMINDSMGHAAGDDCLKQLACVLKQFTKRPSDIAARYGGEEFVLVLGHTKLDEAVKMAERIRQAVMDLDIRFGGERLMTVSIGVAALGEQPSYQPRLQQTQNHWLNFSEDGNLLLEQADKALYVAKKQGRNRVEVYDKHHRLSTPLMA